MMLAVLDYSIVSKIATLSLEMYNVRKEHWRYLNRRLSSTAKEEINRIRELTRYWVMNGNEVTPEKGIKTLNTIKSHSSLIVSNLQRIDKDFDADINKLNEVIEEVESIICLIELTEHKESAWNKL